MRFKVTGKVDFRKDGDGWTHKRVREIVEAESPQAAFRMVVDQMGVSELPAVATDLECEQIKEV